jgi:hypothetical protein
MACFETSLWEELQPQEKALEKWVESRRSHPSSTTTAAADSVTILINFQKV